MTTRPFENDRWLVRLKFSCTLIGLIKGVEFITIRRCENRCLLTNLPVLLR